MEKQEMNREMPHRPDRAPHGSKRKSQRARKRAKDRANKAPQAPRKGFRLNKARIEDWFSRLTEELGQSRPFVPGNFETYPAQRFLPDLFAQDYLSSEVLSKLDDGLRSVAKQTTTWDRFFEAEEMCRVTNERLRKASIGDNPMDSRSAHAVVHRARQLMASLLGRFDWNEASVGFGWGPGSTTRISRRKAHASNKFHGRPESTISNAILANAAIAAVPIWRDSLEFQESCGRVSIVPGNRIITVPKNYKTDRTIAIEPCMNMFVQKGLGSVIRRRLRRVGIDLDDQSKNQRFARIGSFAGTLATIDLSMASDTVSYEIVRLLLPPDWFGALEQCRSSFGVLPSDVAKARGVPELLRYQKFSSMGNGYTFELETAIFCVLAWAVADLYGCKDHRISVYGDDIICPTEIAAPLCSVLEVCGFRTNSSKTFISGGFRESCGFHALNGYDVTPFYIRSIPESLDDLFLLHNQLYRWCMRVRGILSVDGFRPFIDELRQMAPDRWKRPRIPDTFGDGAFIGTFDEALPQRARDFIEGYVVRHRVAVSKTWDPENCHIGRLISSLYEQERVPTGISRWGEGAVRDRPRTVTARSLIPQFCLEDPFSSFG